MIHILPPEVANQIAAGEVVERPASVVREFIDNAIDAGAKRIDVEISQGGLGSIRVTDNGSGMSRKDAVLCVKRHATSKILTAGDLAAIATRGFRGEALAAISSVSRFELKTRRPEDELGVAVTVEGGIEGEPKETGTPVGTAATVSDLFYNVPARRKFLKKPTTEQGHVLSTVTSHALAHEGIHFTLTTNNRRTIDWPAVNNRPERIQQIFGKDILSEMIPIGLDTPHVSITGLISRPTMSRNGAQHLFFFVNNRYIKDRILHRALMNGYRNLIHAGRYPVVFLYLELNPVDIDFNVHPTKQEIKFSREDAIYSAVHGAVRRAWDASATTPIETPPLADPQPPIPGIEPSAQTAPTQETKKQPDLSPAEPARETPIVPQTLSSAPIPPTTARESLPVTDSKSEILTDRKKREPTAPTTSPPTSEKSISEKPVPDVIEQLNRQPIVREETAEKTECQSTTDLSECAQTVQKADDLFTAASLENVNEPIIRGQLLNSYILAEGEDGLFVIDQHAAHERLLFEEFLKKSENAPLASQSLLFPLTLDFTPDQVIIIEEQRDLFKRLGFSIEAFGPKTFVVRSIPSTVDMEDAEAFVQDLVGEIQREGSAKERQEKALQTLACRAAVKFGDSLTPAEMQGIVRGMLQIPRRNVCPHGRPVVLLIPKSRLDKAFKRTGF